MAKDKLSSKTEAVRLGPTEAAWLDDWVDATGQDRSKPIRAGVKLLRFALEGMPYEARVRLVSRLSRIDGERDTEDRAEVFGFLGALVTKRGKGKRGRDTP